MAEDGAAATDPFIGRKDDLAFLESLHAQDRFAACAITGRRRIGKTTLLEEFCRGNTALLLQTGSWFTVQSRLRNGFRDECRILPLRSGGRKIIPYSFYFLQTYLRAMIIE